MKDIKRRSISMILAATMFFGMTYTNVYADEEIREIPEEETAVQEMVEEKKEAELIEQIEMLEKVEKKMPALEESVLEEVKEAPAAEELKAEEKEVSAEEEKAAEVQKASVEMVDVAEKKESVEKIKDLAELKPSELNNDKIEEAVPEEAPEDIEEVEEEEPAWVSDAASMKGTTSSTIYLENPDQTVKLSMTNYKADGSKAEDQSINWVSGNESIASVDANGVVTNLSDKTGTVTITAIAANNPDVKKQIKVYIKNVTISNVSISSITGNSNAMIGNPEQYGVKLSNEYALEALGIDEIKYTWTITQGEEYATISQDGLLTPIKAGTVKVKVSNNLNTSTATKSITVKAPVAATRLSVTPTIVKLVTGTDAAPTKQITATVSPTNTTNKTVHWESSDESVATVNEKGLITGVSEGKATITVTPESNPDLAKTITVTVSEYVPLERITIVNAFTRKPVSEMELAPGEYGDVMATIAPANATDSDIVWTCSDPTVLDMIPQGTYNAFEAKQFGTAVVTAASKDGSIYAQLTVNVCEPGPKEYTLRVSHYFLKAYDGGMLYDGAPVNYDFMIEDKPVVLEEGTTIRMGDYIMNAPLSMPHTFMYKDQKYSLSSSYVAALDMDSQDEFEVKSDVDILFTYMAIAPYSVTLHYLDAQTEQPLQEALVYNYESQFGYIDLKYDMSKYIANHSSVPGYTLVRTEGDVKSTWSEKTPDKEVYLYYERVTGLSYTVNYLEKDTGKVLAPAKIVGEMTYGDTVTENAINVKGYEKSGDATATITLSDKAEENVINFYYTANPSGSSKKTDDPVVEEPEDVIEDDDTPLTDPEIEEEPVEEEVADEETPLAGFEEAEDEVMEEPEVPLVHSPLTGDERHTSAWAGLSLASLLGILFLGRKKRMTE